MMSDDIGQPDVKELEQLTSNNSDDAIMMTEEMPVNIVKLVEAEACASRIITTKIIEITSDQTEMLEALSRIPELRAKSQQKSEADLTKEQKLDVLKEIFTSHPMQFLTRFGEYLEPSQLKCFDEFKEDENILFYMKQLEKNISSDARKLRAKNRRYSALQKLVDTTDYFTEELMQRRNPILFDQLIGKYHTKDERNAFLARSEQVAAKSSTTPLTDLLMAHLDRNDEGQSYRRLDQEQQKAEEDEADDEYLDRMDEDDSEEEDPRRRCNQSSGGTENQDGEEIEDEEKELLKEEFFTTMYRDFLEGRDADFDYATVDNNDEYDVGEDLEQDEEEKYFGDEEPYDINSESNSEMDELFRPPVRSSEIESKIQTLTVTNSGSSNEVNTTKMACECDEGDDEDELDAYMRGIERELQNK